MLSTCFIYGSRSGAERSNPETLLDLKLSAAAAISEKPSLNWRNDCRKAQSPLAMWCIQHGFTHPKNFMEIFGFARASVNARYDAFQIRETFR